MNKMKSYFVDLDGTLIFSHRHYHEGYRPIEIYQDREISFIDNDTYSLLIPAIQDGSFIPVTSRTRAQYDRISIFQEYRPRYALIDNGGMLLVDGEADPLWLEETYEILGSSAEGLKEIEAWAGEMAPAKMQDDLVLFIKPEDQDTRSGIVHRLEDNPEFYWFDHGKKLYICSELLTKGNSVRRLKERFGIHRCAGAGDGEVDFSMIDQVDVFVTGLANRDKIQGDNLVFVEAKDVALTVLNMK